MRSGTEVVVQLCEGRRHPLGGVQLQGRVLTSSGISLQLVPMLSPCALCGQILGRGGGIIAHS